MKKKYIIALLLLILLLPLSNQKLRLRIFAQQQQGTLNFSLPSTEPAPSTSIVQRTEPLESGVRQVDWVYDNMGRCWNAWSAPSCGLQQHEGGVVIPAMQDLDHDGAQDISCSQGGTDQGTTITNTSDNPITINCERYVCNSCATGDGIHAQCDGGTDPDAERIVETVTLTPGCTATCTMQGVYGSCLPDKTPPTPEEPTTVPTDIPAPPTATPPITLHPSATSSPTTTAVPTATTIPTTIPTSISSPTPTSIVRGLHLPVAIDYSSYAASYNEYPPTYLYAMMNRSYDAQQTQRGIQGLSQVQGNVIKMIMISEYEALEAILSNHGDDLKAAGVTWVGYNAERDGRTPETELQNIFSPNPSVNVINKMGRLTDQYGFKLMLGPVTPMWNEFFNRSDTDQVAEAMIGNNCYLDGVAFQEQKQISRTNKQERASIIAERTAFFREHAGNCEFESMVQIMSSWCEQNASWEECKGYYELLKGLDGSSQINSLAIWASGSERNDLPRFIEFLRQ